MAKMWEELGEGWYFSEEEILKSSPSRKDGIDEKGEDALRKSYSKFLNSLGNQLNAGESITAKSIILCHRFFLRQSHHKNDRYTVAAACMFVASKDSDSPLRIRDITRASSRILKRPAMNDQLMQVAEHLVLSTVNFVVDMETPYTYLSAAIVKLDVSDQNSDFPRTSRNFVNDILPTTLCVEFVPHHIAAAAFYLASKYLNFVLPRNVHWWQEFDITPQQLKKVTNQMLKYCGKQNLCINTAGHNRPNICGNDVSLHSKPANNDSKRSQAVNNDAPLHSKRSQAVSSVIDPSSNLSSTQPQKRGGDEIENGELQCEGLVQRKRCEVAEQRLVPIRLPNGKVVLSVKRRRVTSPWYHMKNHKPPDKDTP